MWIRAMMLTADWARVPETNNCNANLKSSSYCPLEQAGGIIGHEQEQSCLVRPGDQPGYELVM